MGIEEDETEAMALHFESRSLSSPDGNQHYPPFSYQHALHGEMCLREHASLPLSGANAGGGASTALRPSLRLPWAPFPRLPQPASAAKTAKANSRFDSFIRIAS